MYHSLLVNVLTLMATLAASLMLHQHCLGLECERKVGDMCKNNHKLLFLTSLAVIASRELCCRHGCAENPAGTNMAAWEFPAQLKHLLFSFKPTLCHFGYVMTNNDEKLDCSRQSSSENTLRVLPHLSGGAEPLALKTKWHFNKYWIKHNAFPNGYSASLTMPAV